MSAMPDLPRVSIVIPSKNSSATVGAAVESALSQDYTGPIEVIVADGSTDTTRQVLEDLAPSVTVVDNPSGKTPDALNTAIAVASGEVIVRCDAHAVLPSGYVRMAVETLEATGAANVGGLQEAEGVGAWQRAVAVAQSTPLGVGDARYRLGGDAGPVDTVYLGVFRREWLDRVGGFDPRFERNQDYELNWRIRQAGGMVWFDPRLQVSYRPRSSLRALARQYHEYGIWKRRMLAIHPASVRPRQLAAPVLVIALGLSLVAAPFAPLVGAVTPAAYAIALVGTAAVEAARRRDPAAWLTVLAIPTMHLSWGWGFLTAQRMADR